MTECRKVSLWGVSDLGLPWVFGCFVLRHLQGWLNR